jgi:hypothetical protein
MRRFRFGWLLVVGVGVLFIGVALASGAADTPLSDHPGVVQAEDCAEAAADVPGVEAAVQTGDNPCLDCHTDEERLTELAVEEETESLSEGPG